MILNINAINNRGAVCENNGNLVSIGGTMLRDRRFSEEVEFTGNPAYCLLIADGMVGRALTGVVWLEDKICLINDGDSRTYLFRDGIVEHLTVDEENEESLPANCLGGGFDTALAVTEITGKLQDGDILLICSDSIADVVNDDYLEHFLMNSASPAEELAEWAMENGSTDNVSVIAARIGGGEFCDSDDFPDDDGRFDAWA